METTVKSPPVFSKRCSIANIIEDVPTTQTTTQKRRSTTFRESQTKKIVPLNRGWIHAIRVLCIVCTLVIWIFFFIPALLHTRNINTNELNDTVNEELLGSLNLTSIVVTCPEQYAYSFLSNKCQPACGLWSVCGYICLYIKQGVLAVTAVTGVIVSSYAIFSWIKLRETWKFQHYPIIVCIVVNLFLSLSFTISDVPGVFLYYCHAKLISLEDLNQNPGIHIQITGSLIHYLGLSNRLWFLVALFHIAVVVCYPMKDLFAGTKTIIITLIIENAICFGLPTVAEIVPYTLGITYRYFDEIEMPSLNNITANAVVGFTPHVIITSLTMTLVILILYKTRIQALRMKEFGEGYQLQAIEKRLLVFTVVYFIISSIIVISLIAHAFIDKQNNKTFDDYLALITLQSPYGYINRPGTNETLKSLLSPEKQSLITEVMMPILVYIRGMGNRLMFVSVFVVINVRCGCQKKKPQRKQSISKSNDNVFQNPRVQV